LVEPLLCIPSEPKVLGVFLADTPALIGYVQRLAGLALLGNARDQILPFLHGTGANGKGVLALVLQGLLDDADKGGYAVSGRQTDSSWSAGTSMRPRSPGYVVQGWSLANNRPLGNGSTNQKSKD
jgi:hypothetical protein